MDYDSLKGFGKDFEKTIKRISNHNGVTGVIVTQDRGQPVYSTMDNNKTYLFTSKLTDFSQMARSTIRQMNPENDLDVIRIKTTKYEIMVATPNLDHSIIAIQQVRQATSEEQ